MCLFGNGFSVGVTSYHRQVPVRQRFFRMVTPYPPASACSATLIFPVEWGTPFSGWSKAKSALETASGVSGWWLHDLRRTLATGLQRLGVRLEVTEAVLNHLSGSRAGVVGIYQRHDWAEEKRAALDAWSAHLLAAAEGRLTAVKVLPFRRARSGEI